MPPNFRSTLEKATDLLQKGKIGQATTIIRQSLWPQSPPSPPPPQAPEPADAEPVQFRTGFRSPRVVSPSPARHGRFVDGPDGRYKLYIPAEPDDDVRRPLVVMLHGCTQDPDDFAAGTGMNRRADESGFYVLYPAQAMSANPSRCWNWFRPEDQQRDRGEPAAIAGMTKALIAEERIDPDRVYIAGLSAGGAMAAIVAARYPDLFAAVGVHSGLRDGAARNLPDALSVMRTGNARGRVDASGRESVVVPTIVFHGDEDRTVHPSNGVGLVDLALRGAGPVTERTVDEPSHGRTKPYTRTEYLDAAGRAVVESWVVHGGTHAWSGGHIEGRYTDPEGPSATDAMLRFFLDHRRQVRA